VFLEDMTAKERVILLLQNLPEDASVEDAMEHLLLFAKIEKGLLQADSEQTFPHHQLKERMSKRLE
jgi:hypothetical protein